MKPRVVTLHSENNDFQYVETLRRNRVKRHRAREFFVEGVRAINEALAHDWTVTAFLYSRDKPLSGWAEDILARSRARTHYQLPLSLLQKLSDKSDTSELLATIAMPEDRLERIPLTSDLCVVVVDRPASPGNLGTLIRSCDAFGVDGLVISGHAVDLYDPETIRATTGSFFAVPAVHVAGPADLLPWFETIRATVGPCAIVGSSARATQNLSAHDWTGPVVLLVGNETWGLSAHFKELCDTMVTIPISGSATSLNVACAASIMLYEMDRQRRAARQRGG